MYVHVIRFFIVLPRQPDKYQFGQFLRKNFVNHDCLNPGLNGFRQLIRSVSCFFYSNDIQNPEAKNTMAKTLREQGQRLHHVCKKAD
jgi:hypothetical protein